MNGLKSDVIVIGGGIAGLTSSLALADLGITVTILEREPRLGGHAAKWACMATDSCGRCSACLVENEIEKVKNHPDIQAVTGVEIEEFKGSAGDFTLSVRAISTHKGEGAPADNALKPLQGIRTFHSASIVVATGFVPYDASQNIMLSYGRIPEVFTIQDVDEALKQEDVAAILPDNPKRSRIAFIMCVGSRDRKHGRDYCSQFCGKTSVRLINKLKYARPEFNFDMYYIDLQIMCKEFSSFYNKMQDAITFYQGIPAEVLDGPEENTALLHAHNPETGNFEERVYDRIVLANGIAPNQANGQLAKVLGIGLNPFGFFEHSHEAGAFTSSVPGIYLAGASAGPTDIAGSRLQALAAAHQIAVSLTQTVTDENRDFAGHSVNRKIFISGGSASAFYVAQSAAGAGLEPVLLYREPGPDTLFPPDAGLIESVENNPAVEILRDMKTVRLSGEAGNFNVDTVKAGEPFQYSVSVVVVADEPEAFPLELDETETGGKVQTLNSFLKDAAEEKVKSQAIGFWLDRAIPERRDVITAVLRGAIDNINSGGKSYIYLRNMPIFGHLGQQTYDEARKLGVQFLRYGEGHPVFEKGEKGIEATVRDAVLQNVLLKVTLDRLVMPSLIMPGKGIVEAARLLGRPLDSEGFLQSDNVRHYPVSSARKGIYFAGGCHDHFDPSEARLEAEAVTMKILGLLLEKCPAEATGLMHIDKSKCVKCLTCVRSCPHGAIDPFNLRAPINIYENACWECGICAAVCPGQAITLVRKPDNILNIPMKNLEKTASGGLKTTVFACQQSAVPALNKAAEQGQVLPEGTEVVELPCAGRIKEAQLLEVLAKGADRVMVAGCHPDICRSLRGNLLAAQRVERVKGMLEAMQIDTDRVRFQPVAANEPLKLLNAISAMADSKDRTTVPATA